MSTYLWDATLGQEKLEYELLGGITYTNLSEGILSNWGKGWNIGVGVAYEVAPRIQLIASQSYHQLPFRGGNLQLALPRVWVRPFNSVPGLTRRAGGERSEIYETSVGLRFISQGQYLKPFLTARTGFYFINIGEIVITEESDQNSRATPPYTYGGSGITVMNGFGALSLGVDVPLSSKFGIKVEGTVLYSSDGVSTFLPVVSTVSFRL